MGFLSALNLGGNSYKLKPGNFYECQSMEQWNALTQEQQDEYDYVLITGDEEEQDLTNAYLTTDSSVSTIAQGDYIPILKTDNSKKKVLWSTIIAKIKSALSAVAESGSFNDLSDTPTLGTAAAKDSTDAVTSGSTDLVESGAVYTEVDSVKQALSTENLGNIASISELETALTDLIPNIGLGAVKPFIFTNTANLGSPFPQITGGWNGTIQPRSTASANVNSALIHIWNQLGHDCTIIGFNNNGTFTWYEDGFDGATVKSTVSKTISGDAITQIIPANTSMDSVIEYLQHNDRGVYYGMSSWSFWNASNLNKIGAVIPARKWFWFNGKLCRALADIAKDAAMTLNTNYKQVASLDTLGSTEVIYSGGKTLDGTTKNLAYDIRRYRYIIIEIRSNVEYDFMIIPISILALNTSYMRVFLGESSGKQGLVSAMDLMANVRVTFLSYTTFKAVGAYTYDGWQVGVSRIIGIY